MRGRVLNALMGLLVIVTWAILAVVVVVAATFVLSHMHGTCGIAAAGPSC